MRLFSRALKAGSHAPEIYRMQDRTNSVARQSPQVLLAANVRLRLFCVALGLCWAALFPIVGLRYQLQTYGDGSLFTYAIAVQEAWAFHWHNISGRFTVYLLAHAPAEAYLALTGNARSAVALYGLIFFSAPLLGLWATFALDRSAKRTLFTFACVSTSASLPLVFGFPTEMWVAHALFWPTLALALDANDSRRSRFLDTTLFALLVMSHGGGVLLGDDEKPLPNWPGRASAAARTIWNAAWALRTSRSVEVTMSCTAPTYAGCATLTATAADAPIAAR